jgi:hypothetical protein
MGSGARNGIEPPAGFVRPGQGAPVAFCRRARIATASLPCCCFRMRSPNPLELGNLSKSNRQIYFLAPKEQFSVCRDEMAV